MFGKPRVDTHELVNATKLTGLFYTLPRKEIAALRKAWTDAHRQTGVSAARFVIDRYGLNVYEGDVVPTRGAAIYVPLRWEPRDGYGPQAGATFVTDTLAGR